MPQASVTGRTGSGRPLPPYRAQARLPGLDSWSNAALAPLTGGVSPVTLASAFTDWMQHLALSPDKQCELARQTAGQFFRHANYCWRAWADPAHAGGSAFAPDARFAGRLWELWPYNVWREGFLNLQRWWREAATGVHGVSGQHERMVAFILRQWLDAVSPASFPAINPEVLKATVASGGFNFLYGAAAFMDDLGRTAAPAAKAGQFEPGRNLAATPGKVIFRNHLIELIQYRPATSQVRPEPVLIIPAWLMKYYILDLAPGQSLAEFLVRKGHTVFMVSWRNPQSEDRDLNLEDYRQQGIMAALDAVRSIVPDRRIHGVGYCLGGTLLAAAAAAMGREGDDRLASMTLFAAQTDFAERGQLMLFIDETQVDFLESLMALDGYLDFKRLVGMLRLWRTGDFVWSGMVRNYLIGDGQPMTEYTAWTLDATRLPARMHSEYLRKLVLGNDLAGGRYRVNGRPVSLHDIRIPVFAVSTERDHIAPWRSIYNMHRLTGGPLTFVLAEGDHHAGIVSPPGSGNGYYRITARQEFDAHPDSDDWRATAGRHGGSWWPCWQSWLAKLSGVPERPPGTGAPSRGLTPLCDAPGSYVVMP